MSGDADFPLQIYLTDKDGQQIVVPLPPGKAEQVRDELTRMIDALAPR